MEDARSDLAAELHHRARTPWPAGAVAEQHAIGNRRLIEEQLASIERT